MTEKKYRLLYVVSRAHLYMTAEEVARLLLDLI